jgi:hypothetical protein
VRCCDRCAAGGCRSADGTADLGVGTGCACVGASIDPVALLARWRHARHSHSALIEVLSGLRDELRSGGGLREAFERGREWSVGIRRSARAVGHEPAWWRCAVRRCGQDGEEQPVVLSLAALWEVSEGFRRGLGRRLGPAGGRRRTGRAGAPGGGARNWRGAGGATVRGARPAPADRAGGWVCLMGADPVGFLLGTPWGWACLVLGRAVGGRGPVLDASSGVRGSRHTCERGCCCAFGVWLLVHREPGTGAGSARPPADRERPPGGIPARRSWHLLLLLGGPWGLACGVAVAVGARWLLRRLSRGESPRHEQVVRIAPEAVECIAACVAAGAPLWAAMSSVADSFAGPMGDLLRRTAARHDLG